MQTSISKPPLVPESHTDGARLRGEIEAWARDLGFSAFGIAAAGPGPERDSLKEFLARGFHGDMAWMATHAVRRGDPNALWPDARSIIMLAADYTPQQPPGDILRAPGHGAISVYAQGADYHKVMKKRLKRLAGDIAHRLGGEVKLFVDTAPVMEKPLAMRAGLGWQGKHSNLVSRDFGSWLFLAEIFTTLDLPPDDAAQDACGSCRACLDSCPTNAFPAPYQLDARRCISYLTIEHKGHIAREFRAAMGNRIYGCDDCLAICPWNKFARAGAEHAFQPRTELSAPRLAALAELDDAAFRAYFSGSPIKRTGRDRFLRNVMIAIGNSGDSALLGVVERRLTDDSPLVRAMAVWALARLAPGPIFERLRAEYITTEGDSDVVAEWCATQP
ncbi:MAG: tRNA epoxyqueuosine(34) reductase QueG [Proteobacteria bacterium]|nr:tRNA epoxyqueuosine(34) reductase QueG [Pseudomonadota bacterium]MDA1354718.1 tRNA epoxyqueuosine(34) reductase QueG [Pseudomonadota bacterium]